MSRTGGAIALAALLSSCSFVFVSAPPPNHAEVPAFRCTSGKTFPIIDTIVAGALAVAAVAVVTRTDQQWHDMYCNANDTTCTPPGKTAAIATYAAIAAVMAPSAVFGFYTTNDCADAKLALLRRSHEIAPGAPPEPNAPQNGPPPIGNPPPQGPPAQPAHDPFPSPPAQGSASTPQ